MVENKVSRKIQIMQTLAEMLEEKEPVKITTAELAKEQTLQKPQYIDIFLVKEKFMGNGDLFRI